MKLEQEFVWRVGESGLVGEVRQPQKYHWVEDWLAVPELEWWTGKERDWLWLELEKQKH